ncbi:hypothetical protein MKX01_035531 [Papaver californicum]|nr:hypothetical protein MKX01_035531 [Papaver californicum]
MSTSLRVLYPHRKMGPQFRSLCTKAIRNFLSKVDGAKEVPEESFSKTGRTIISCTSGGLWGLIWNFCRSK